MKALFSKAVRRELEPAWAADTQRRILAMGLWPKGLTVPDDWKKKARTVAGFPVINLSNRMMPEDHQMQEIETTTPAARGQSARMVWDAILELHNAEKRINRQSIAALTGLRPTIVDDHVERLRDAGKLARAARIAVAARKRRRLDDATAESVKLDPRPIRAIARELGVPFSLVQGIKAGITYKTSANNPWAGLLRP